MTVHTTRSSRAGRPGSNVRGPGPAVAQQDGYAPETNFAEISFSDGGSATAFGSRLFSKFGFWSHRFWSSLGPPISLLQRWQVPSGAPIARMALAPCRCEKSSHRPVAVPTVGSGPCRVPAMDPPRQFH